MTSPAPAVSGPLTLQALVFPEPSITCPDTLYARLSGGAEFTPEAGGLTLPSGARAELDTWFNLFDAGTWGRVCGLKTLALRLSGTGPVSLSVQHSRPDQPDVLLAEEELDLAAGAEATIALPAPAPDGAIHLALTARDANARITAGRFTTDDAPRRAVRLAVTITTFRREAAVAETAARLGRFLADYEHADGLMGQIIDNGQSASLPDTSPLRLIANANLGGAGGFARGLIEARNAGASHCLFMDDDAAFHMENIRRTFALMTLAENPATALAGGMITNTNPHQLWEYGATFDGICHPDFNRAVLTDRDQLIATVDAAARAPLPANGYGGWWFFAFPIASVVRFPFPFFVRGDDSGFSMANPFEIRRLAGVVSFQDAFGEKESPLVHYLDMRYHLAHHLVFTQIARGRLGTAWVPLQMLLREISKFHYETVEAQLMALDDVLRGPDFFVDHADMSLRRPALTALKNTESWTATEATPEAPVRGGKLRELLWALSLNGHLLPFHGALAHPRVLPMALRGPIWPIFGARALTYVNQATGEGYTATFDRRRGLGLFWRSLKAAATVAWRLPRLRALYHTRYPAVASEDTWRHLLDLEADTDRPKR